jgi:predicted transcriptional regulator
METITSSYQEAIDFTHSCYDRMIFKGILPEISHAKGMTSYLYDKKERIFDYPQFAKQLNEKIRSNIEEKAKEAGITIEFVRKSGVRKESLVAEKLKERGSAPGIVAILSAMETCNTYLPWHDKLGGKTFVKHSQSKCLHYYVYFMDEEAGFGYIRIPTWCPFGLQIYLNGHNLVAKQLDKAGIGYTMLDNSFDSLEDAEKAQELSDALDINALHRKMDELAWLYCPVYKELGLRYHWSVMQIEYATDIVFKRPKDLQKMYSEIVNTAIHTVKPDNISTFLGRKLTGQYQGEMGNKYKVRIEGSCIKHIMGSSSIKMYDKFGKTLRIETTSNDISFFKHYREVEHRDGTTSYEVAPLKKSIHSLGVLSKIMKACNKRYIDFISAFDNKEIGRDRLEKITSSKTENNRNYKGINFFKKDDVALLLAIVRGEFNVNGFRNKHLQKLLGFTGAKISRLIKRLHVHGLIKKVTNSYKYHLTKMGKETIIMAQKLKELVFVPAYCY